jgi:predicted HicB family RNase H-like nuclease
MSYMPEYKGYTAFIANNEDGMFYGRVNEDRVHLSFEAPTLEQLIREFHFSVDDYLKMCEEKGIEPKQ